MKNVLRITMTFRPIRMINYYWYDMQTIRVHNTNMSYMSQTLPYKTLSWLAKQVTLEQLLHVTMLLPDSRGRLVLLADLCCSALVDGMTVWDI